MFDIGFWELSLIGVVALLVIGPERLPGVARTAGLWIGKGRRFMSSVKGEIDRELKADELKRIMAEQAKSSGLYDIGEQAREGLSKVEQGLGQSVVEPAASTPSTINLKTQSSKSTGAQGDIKPAANSGDEPKQHG